MGLLVVFQSLGNRSLSGGLLGVYSLPDDESEGCSTSLRTMWDTPCCLA